VRSRIHRFLKLERPSQAQLTPARGAARPLLLQIKPCTADAAHHPRCLLVVFFSSFWEGVLVPAAAASIGGRAGNRLSPARRIRSLAPPRVRVRAIWTGLAVGHQALHHPARSACPLRTQPLGRDRRSQPRAALQARAAAAAMASSESMRPYLRLQNLFAREIDPALTKDVVLAELAKYCPPGQGKVVIPISDSTGGILGIAYLNYMSTSEGGEGGGAGHKTAVSRGVDGAGQTPCGVQSSAVPCDRLDAWETRHAADSNQACCSATAWRRLRDDSALTHAARAMRPCTSPPSRARARAPALQHDSPWEAGAAYIRRGAPMPGASLRALWSALPGHHQGVPRGAIHAAAAAAWFSSRERAQRADLPSVASRVRSWCTHGRGQHPRTQPGSECQAEACHCQAEACHGARLTSKTPTHM
jgi:hypothetical protein